MICLCAKCWYISHSSCKFTSFCWIYNPLSDAELYKFRCAVSVNSTIFCTFALHLMNMGRILAIDYGQKRVGLAVTDPLQMIANSLDTIAAHEVLAYIAAYVTREQVDKFVVGLPKQMSGADSESMQYIRPFVKNWRKSSRLFRLCMSMNDLHRFWHIRRCSMEVWRKKTGRIKRWSTVSRQPLYCRLIWKAPDEIRS